MKPKIVEIEEKPNEIEAEEKTELSALQSSKGSKGWTEERRKKQQLRMLKVIAAGKAFKGKPQEAPIIEQVPEIVPPIEAAPRSYWMNGIIIFVLTLIAGLIFLIKTGSIKIEKEE